MNILKSQSHNISTILYIDSSIPSLNNYIIKLSKISDIYVFITKSSKIDPKIYCSLLSINGYITGSLDKCVSYIKILEYLSEISENYYMYFIPYPHFDDTVIIDKIDELFRSGMVSSSIFLSEESPFSELEEVYMKVSNIKKLFNKLLGKKDSLYCSEVCNGNIVLRKSDIDKITENISSDHLMLFNNKSIFYFIPSIFKKLGMTHLNIDPVQVLETPKTLSM